MKYKLRILQKQTVRKMYNNHAKSDSKNRRSFLALLFASGSEALGKTQEGNNAKSKLINRTESAGDNHNESLYMEYASCYQKQR